MKVKPFGILPTMFMMILSVGLVNHVLVVPLLLDAAKRDAWICVLIGIVVVLPWAVFPLYGLLKRMNGMPIDQWLGQRFPRFVVGLVIGIFLVIQLLLAFETLIVTVSWTATTYLPKTPSVVVCTVFLGLCFFASISGLRAIAYASCILLPLVVFLGDFVMSANLPHKDYHYLLPMFENGTDAIMRGVFYTLTSTSELFGFIFIQHHVRGEFKRWHFVLLVLFLSLLTLGPAMGAISEFGPVEAAMMRYPSFSQWRLVSIGKYFEHVDFFAIFQWMSGSLIRLSISIHILSEFTPMRRWKIKWISPSVIAGLILVVSVYGINHMLTIRQAMYTFFMYCGVVVMLVTCFIWLFSLLWKKKKEIGKQVITGSEEAEQ